MNRTERGNADTDVATISPLARAAMAGVCSDTVNGWLWYCDEHDTHGNADTEEEAWAYADTHLAFKEATEEDGDCYFVVWRRAHSA